MEEELGDDPTFLLGLTLFLAEGTAVEQDDAPSSLTPVLMDSPQLSPSKDPHTTPSTQEEHDWRSLPNPLLLDWNPNQGQKGTSSGEPPLSMDPGGEEQNQRPSPLVEGNQNKWEGLHGNTHNEGVLLWC